MPTTHLYPNLTKDEQDTVRRSEDFFREVEHMCEKGLRGSVGELITRLQQSGQFESELEGLMPQYDYEAACDNANIEVVEGANEVFYFKWDELSSIEVDYDDQTSMVDWNAFATANGIDTTKYKWDAFNDEPVRPTEANEQDAEVALCNEPLLEAVIGRNRPDGSDMVALFESLARLEGHNELADKLNKHSVRDMKALLSPHIDKNFVSSQSNSDVEDAYRNACDEFRLDADMVEILEHHSVSPDFARRLEETGHVVAEVMGLHVWGRTTSGQSMALDWSVQQMCLKQWEYGVDEVVRKVLPEAAARIDAQAAAEREQERSASTPSLG